MKKQLLVFSLSCLFVNCAVQKAVQVPPPGTVVIAERPTLTVGSQFIYQETDVLIKKVTDYAWTIKEIQPYNGGSKQLAYFFSVAKYYNGKTGSEESCLIYDSDLNAVARLVDGREVRAATPCIRTFSWPLWPRKKWKTSYTFFFEKGKLDVTDSVVVEDYERLQVPAGTFNVFKIKRVSLSQTHWEYVDYYSPDVKIAVRMEKTRLATHPEGYGKWVTELIQFSTP